MADFSFKYGDGHLDFSFPDEDIIKVIEPPTLDIPNTTEGEKVLAAIENPIGCPKLEDSIKATDTVCIMVPDMTRQWGHPAEVVKVLVKKLNDIGVKDENMLIVSAVGSHREQTPEEHALIVSPEVYAKVKVVDHDCDSNLVNLGKSSRNNDILVNATVMQYDKKITVGGVVFHFLAGFGGARKYVLPGISGRDSIMDNHSQYFAEGGVGSGRNPRVAPGLYEDNPISLEMFEFADKVGIDFAINVVMGPNKDIAFCYAGELHASHAAGVEMCRFLDGAEVEEAADMVITCGMGYPKDINLYQTSAKPLNNAVGIIKDQHSSVIIIVAECREGIGSADTENMLFNFDNAYDREVYTRENYTIGLNVAYFLTQFGEDYNIIMVTALDPSIFAKSKIRVAETIDEAIALGKELSGIAHPRTYIMPYGANTCGTLKK